VSVICNLWNDHFKSVYNSVVDAGAQDTYNNRVNQIEAILNQLMVFQYEGCGSHFVAKRKVKVMGLR